MSIETISGLTPEEQEFVDLSRGGLESQLKELEQPVSWYIAHGKRRPVRQMNEILEQRKEQRRDTERALGILSGNIPGEISFIRDKDKQILGFKV